MCQMRVWCFPLHVLRRQSDGLDFVQDLIEYLSLGARFVQYPVLKVLTVLSLSVVEGR
jgi:hypothetical protein